MLPFEVHAHELFESHKIMKHNKFFPFKVKLLINIITLNKTCALFEVKRLHLKHCCFKKYIIWGWMRF